MIQFHKESTRPDMQDFKLQIKTKHTLTV